MYALCIEYIEALITPAFVDHVATRTLARYAMVRNEHILDIIRC